LWGLATQLTAPASWEAGASWEEGSRFVEELVLFLLVLALAGLVVVWGNDRAKRRRAEQALAQLNQHAYQTFEVGSSR
jgi:hypothetical protein